MTKLPACVLVVAAVLVAFRSPLDVRAAPWAQAGDPTSIANWQDGRSGAVSITFDDASINQFRVALPLLDERGLAGTFFVITGAVAGSIHQARFVGRPIDEILRESATVPTDATNYLERMSAAPFLGYAGLLGFRTRAPRPTPELFARIDEAYARVRGGELEPLPSGAYVYMDNAGDVIQAPPRPDIQHITWDALQTFASRGHEIASHTISHPRLDALDDANIRDELERSRDEILRHLGPAHAFSVELPFGIEDERAVRHGLDIYQASRNRMPEPWLDELNRSSQRDPTTSDRPYVQWQRGLLDETTTETMRSWVDTAAADDNIWLVLVIHGVEGIGWEAIPRATLASFFDHLAGTRDHVWVATFQDVTKYMRERSHGSVRTVTDGQVLRVTVTHTLDRSIYDLPLTLETYVPADWTRVRVVQGASSTLVVPQRDAGGVFVTYRAIPNAEEIVLSGE